jgi:transposase
MSKQVFYVGVDVGKEELWAVVEDRKPRAFSHTTKGIKAMLVWARRIAGELPVHVCMEATGVYSRGLAVRLCALDGVSVSIVNPAQIAAFAKAQLRRCKTDGIDARVILEFAKSQKPPVWKPEPTSLQQLYQLVAQADALRGSLQQWANRRHAHGYISDLHTTVAKTQQAIERTLKRQLAAIEKAIEQLCVSNQEIKEQVELLSTVPGIAKHSATQILAYGKSALTDRSQKALVAHAGLAPHHRQSGTSIRGKSSISKQGDRRLRTALFMPTLVGIVHNPKIKQYYQHLLQKGKPKMVALVACMRKLLTMIRAMLKNNLPFDLNYALDR